MKLRRYEVILLLIVLLSFMLLGAGSISVYFGTVRATQDGKLTMMLKGGSEKTLKMNKDTRVFAAGRLVPFTRIKPNSQVQAAADSDGLCLQVVVEEGPK
ncbi:MAG: hypothetical protein M0023_06140 [Desulfobacteraceae bacterium]|nr:hypothetical protein [Desulfobacteraceae bacterium]